MRYSGLLAAIAIVCACVSNAFSQAYPSKPIKLVVPYPPGGVHDTLARLLQPRLAEGFGQQVIIENRLGAAGNVAAEAVAKSPADGYTALITTDALGVAPQLYKNAGFSTFKDFAPVTKLAAYPMALVCNPGFPASTVGELVARARALPGQINIASPGSGTQNHLVAELFKTMAGIDLLHIPYKGAAPAMTDVIAGRVQCIFITPAVWMPQARTGKLKILAVTSATRLSLASETPTFVESGYPSFEAEIHTGLLAPAATPAPIVQRLNEEASKALRSPEVQARLVALGAVVASTTPSEYLAFLRREYDRWGNLIRERGIRGD